jgi:hypothetical protein
LQVIFEWVIRTPKKWGLWEIYLLWGFWVGGVMTHLFGKKKTRPTICWEWNFEFLPVPGKKRAQKSGLVRVAQKIFEF